MTNGIYNVPALDLLTNLDTGSIGAIITDPPTNIHDKLINDEEIEMVPVEAATKWALPHAQQAYRVLRRGGSLVVMGGSQSLAAWELAASRAGLSWMAEIVVLWNTGKPRARNFGSLSTAIRWYVKPGARHSFHAGDVRSIYSNIIVARKVPIDQRVHAAQKPVELTNFLCSLLTDDNDTIVDPFCGAGTTLVSAVYCDRDFIGSDIQPESVRVAQARVSRAQVGEDEDMNQLYLWLNNKLIPIEE